MRDNFRKAKNIICNRLPDIAKAGVVKALPRFYRYFFKYKPEYAALNVTGNCCFKCIMCNQWANRTNEELSTQEWKNAFSQLKSLGINSIGLAGGEPFLRNDIFELILFAQALGLSVTIITNGYLLNEGLITKAIEAGVGSFFVSVDAVGSDFDAIRGIPGAYEKVINACKILSERKKQNMINAYLHFTLTKNTLRTYRDVFGVAKKFHLPFIVNLFDYTPYFFTDLKDKKKEFWIDDNDISLMNEFQQFLIDQKRKDSSSVYHTYAEIDYFRNYFKDPLQKNMPCVISQKRLGMDSQGNVYGGCWSMGSFGNIRKNTLSDIICSKSYKDACRRMFFKQCPGCSCGYIKNVRSYIPAMFNEVAYRLIPGLRRKIYR